MTIAKLLEKAKGKPVIVGLKNERVVGTFEEADAHLNILLSDADVQDEGGNTKARYATIALRGSVIQYVAFSG